MLSHVFCGSIYFGSLWYDRDLSRENGKSKVLKAEMKETASFSGKCKSINTVLEAKHDEKKKKVNYHTIVH